MLPSALWPGPEEPHPLEHPICTLRIAGPFWNMLHGPGSRQCLWPQARPAGPGRQVHRPVFVCLKTSLP